MKIVIKDGQLKTFTDKGTISEQLRNMERLIIEVQKHADNMQKVTNRVRNVDSALVEANEELRRQNAIQSTTIAMADGQLKRNREERRAAR